MDTTIRLCRRQIHNIPLAWTNIALPQSQNTQNTPPVSLLDSSVNFHVDNRIGLLPPPHENTTRKLREHCIPRIRTQVLTNCETKALKIKFKKRVTDIKEDLILAMLDALASPRHGVRQCYRRSWCRLQSIPFL